jgi:hypothetical protein
MAYKSIAHGRKDWLMSAALPSPVTEAHLEHVLLDLNPSSISTKSKEVTSVQSR